MKGRRLHLAVAVLASGLCALGGSRPASQPAPFWMSPNPARHAGTIVTLGAGQSTNWSGYNQGFLEKAELFISVSSQFNGPAERQDTPGQAESISVWVGIVGCWLETKGRHSDPPADQAGPDKR